MTKRTGTKKGFTLIEMMVSVTLFVIVMLVVTSLFLSLVAVNKKAQFQKFVFDNVYHTLEVFVRHIRSGTSYACIPAGPSCTTFAFVDADGQSVRYRVLNGAIERSVNGGAAYDPITASNVRINTLRFYLFGDGVDTQQRALVIISGTAGTSSLAATFTLQTTLAQSLGEEF